MVVIYVLPLESVAIVQGYRLENDRALDSAIICLCLYE